MERWRSPDNEQELQQAARGLLQLSLLSDFLEWFQVSRKKEKKEEEKHLQDLEKTTRSTRLLLGWTCKGGYGIKGQGLASLVLYG